MVFRIATSFSQTVLESKLIVSDIKAIIPQLKHLQKRIDGESLQDNDLIIGLDDPNEVVTITGDYYLDGDVEIYNQGVLNLKGADFRINGDIFILGQGHLNVQGGSFTIIQSYIYEHQAILLENGKLTLSNVDFQSRGQSWSIGQTGSSQYILKDSEISDGFITVALLENSSAHISNTKTPGEFLCFDNNSIEFYHSDFLLQWLVLPDSSLVDVSLPDDSLVTNWQFSNADPKVNNIPYSLKIDSCTNVMWGLISVTGSEAVFRDTEFRTIGLMFTDPDSIVVSNITNESSHVNHVVNVPDRNLHLVNCDVHTWSFYTSQNANLAINNCIFGELISQDGSRVLIDNSVCDGTGGYLGAFNNSLLIVTRSLISSQVISRNRGVLVGAETAFWGSHIAADESSVMLMANTARSIEPEAHSSAVIFEAQLPYVEGNIESIVPVIGTARILSGPDIDIDFNGYEVHYSQNPEDPVWNSISGVHSQPVINDTLDLWNTAGFSDGNYLLKLSIHHNLGDPVSMNSWARLNSKTNISDIDSGYPEQFSLGQNYPNPFNSSTTIPFYLQEPSSVSLRVFDTCGRLKTIIIKKELTTGNYEFNLKCDTWSSGVYYYHLQAGKGSQVKRFLILK